MGLELCGGRVVSVADFDTMVADIVEKVVSQVCVRVHVFFVAWVWFSLIVNVARLSRLLSCVFDVVVVSCDFQCVIVFVCVLFIFVCDPGSNCDLRVVSSRACPLLTFCISRLKWSCF